MSMRGVRAFFKAPRSTLRVVGEETTEKRRAVEGRGGQKCTGDRAAVNKEEFYRETEHGGDERDVDKMCETERHNKRARREDEWGE